MAVNITVGSSVPNPVLNLIGAFDDMLFGMLPVSSSPTQVVLERTGMSGLEASAVISGTGFTTTIVNGDPYLSGGTIQSVDYNTFVGGATDVLDMSNLNLDATLVFNAVLAEETGADITAVEDLLLSLSYNYVGNGFGEFLDEGMTSDDGVPLNFKGNDTFDLKGGADTLFTGDGNDLAYGGSGADILKGGKGDDTLDGGSGADFLYGGNGKDIVYGGKGTDTAYGDNGADTMHGGDGEDKFYGGSSADFIYGDGGKDILIMGDGTDFGRGGDKGDTLYGGAGDDKLYGDAGEDKIFGGKNDDKIWGNDNNDDLKGDKGADTLFGGKGNDKLNGGSGSDVLAGGKGNDKLTGGSGADVFEFAKSSAGNDTIKDFEDGKDMINLGSSSLQSIDEQEGGTLITHDGGTIFIEGNATITFDDFLV